jgi:hypothetical protein
MNKYWIIFSCLTLSLSACYAGSGLTQSNSLESPQAITINGNTTNYNKIVTYKNQPCIIAQEYTNNNMPDTSLICKSAGTWQILIPSLSAGKESKTIIDDNDDIYIVYLDNDSKLSIKTINPATNTSQNLTSNSIISKKNLYDLQLQIINHELYLAYIAYNPDELLLQKYDKNINSLKLIKSFNNIDIVEGHNSSLLSDSPELYLFYPDISGKYSIYNINVAKNTIEDLSQVANLSIDTLPLKILHSSQKNYLLFFKSDDKTINISELGTNQWHIVSQITANLISSDLFAATSDDSGKVSIAFIDTETDNVLHCLSYDTNKNSWKEISSNNTISPTAIDFINKNLILVSQDMLDSQKINIDQFKAVV